MLALQQTCLLTDSAVARFASICHDLGKAETPVETLPHHYGHQQRGAEIADQLARRLKIPAAFRDLALIAARYHTHTHRAFELRPGKLLKLLLAVDSLRKPDRFELFLRICEGDARGRTGFESREYPQADFLRGAAGTIKSLDVGAAAKQASEAGSSTSDAVTRIRIDALKFYISQHRS